MGIAKRFFENTGVLVHHRMQLEAHKSSRDFNIQETSHIALVKDCVAQVEEKLARLQAIDMKVTAGFALGAAALGFSWLLPVTWPLAVAGFAFGAYQLRARESAQSEYAAALKNLTLCCEWSLGEVKKNKQQDTVNHPEIKAMIKVLAPVTTEQNLRDFIDDTIEDGLVNFAKDVKQKTKFGDMELQQNERALYFQMYGYKQGGLKAIISGIGYAIVNACSKAYQACFSKDDNQQEAPASPACCQ